jgi:hypothetical protein
MSKFEIDFFEFSFLVEACIPPRPIARTMFFEKVIDEYYNILTQEERSRLYTWMMRNDQMKNDKEELIVAFKARYNPDNQYTVTTMYKGVKEERDVFMYKGLWYINHNTNIQPEYIINVKKKDND